MTMRLKQKIDKLFEGLTESSCSKCGNWVSWDKAREPSDYSGILCPDCAEKEASTWRRSVLVKDDIFKPMKSRGIYRQGGL